MHLPPTRRLRRADRSTTRSIVLAAVLLAVLPGVAHAAFSGSPGKMAWATDGKLQIDDPFDTAEPRTITTVPKAETPLNFLAPTSAVSWSPDGTKIAFAKAVANGRFPEKTAIFIADVSDPPEGEPQPTVAIQQLSSPYAGKERSCSTCRDGEVTHDHAPVWTSEGEVAFIREVNADPEAPHASELGSAVHTIAVTGGSSRRVSLWNPKADGMMMSMIWPAGASEPVGLAATASGFQLKKTASRHVLASELGIQDADASPDGNRIVYRATTLAGPVIKVIRTSTGEKTYTYNALLSDVGVRFSPDGTRLIMGGCADDEEFVRHCGWKTHLIDDPDAAIDIDEPKEVPYLDGNPSFGAGPTSANGGRSTIDIQSQDVPVIFVPGYLGSEIQCGSERVWMPEDGPPIHLEKVALAADGKSEAACQYAAPTGREVRKFLQTDVYEHGSDWMREIKQHTDDPDGWYTLGWDWRKAPSESLQRVDEQVARLLKRELPTRQGAKRVAFATHSYGSLLVRDYIDTEARAKKVARVVTVGAPWWGAPKPVLPIAFGIETPELSALDFFIKNTNLRTFMTTSAGAYHLAPSDNYGPFLRLDGEQLDQGGVGRFLASTGGVEALHQQARATHQRIDGFKTWRGKIDWRNLTGIGLPTVQGFNVVPLGDGDATLGLVYGQGDGTVPVRSSAQGEEGNTYPLGDDVQTQYRCGIAHMRQTADPISQRAYADFMVSGAVPRKMPYTHCAISGTKVTVFRSLPLGTPLAGRTADRGTARSSGPKSLADAEWAHEADVIQLGGRTTIVSSDGVGDGVTFQGEGDTIEVSRLTADGAGAPRRYGPLHGKVVLAGTAAAPAVTVDGQPVAPQGGGAQPTPTPAPAPTPGPTPTAGDPIAGTLKLNKRLKADAKGRVKITVSARRAAAGTLAITDRKGKALGKAVKVTVKAGKPAGVRLTLSAKTRAKLRRAKLVATVTLTLRAAGVPVSNASAQVTVRR